MSQGGMYELLPIIMNHFIKELGGVDIGCRELKELTGLSDKAVSNNLTRLVNAGFIVRVETRDPNRRGRVVRYRISEEVLSHVKDNLY